jgi:hypothetical protein
MPEGTLDAWYITKVGSCAPGDRVPLLGLNRGAFLTNSWNGEGVGTDRLIFAPGLSDVRDPTQ